MYDTEEEKEMWRGQPQYIRLSARSAL